MFSGTRFRKALVVSAITVAGLLGLVACGDYTYFKVYVSSTLSPRNDIEKCFMTITNDSGARVLDHYLLQNEIQFQSDGTMTLKSNAGCLGGLTNAQIGYFSYSTSRTSGTLNFQVDAVDKDEKIVQTGSATQTIPCPSESAQPDGTCLVEVKIGKP